MNINERLTYYAKFVLGKTQKQVCIDTGLSAGKINRVFNNNQDPGSKVVNAFIAAYPELSPTWVYSGKGNMLLPYSEKKPIEMNVDLYDYRALVARVEELGDRVRVLEEELGIRKASVEEKE